jgi:hypothetical protein
MEALAQPLYVEPPTELWTTVAVSPENDEALRVPFVQQEALAIAGARQAYMHILHEAGRTSGASRELVMSTQRFPQLPADLHERSHAVWGIMRASLVAHEVQATTAEQAWEVAGDEVAWFEAVQTLPDHLQAH